MLKPIRKPQRPYTVATRRWSRSRLPARVLLLPSSLKN